MYQNRTLKRIYKYLFCFNIIMTKNYANNENQNIFLFFFLYSRDLKIYS